MWFIPMIIGLYICIPIIKRLISDERAMKYYLVLSFHFAIVFPWIIRLVNDFAPEIIKKVILALNGNVTNMHMDIVLGYAFYFILGYWISKTDITSKIRTIIYILGVCGFVLTVVLDLAVALRTQQYCANYYGYFSANVFLEAIAVFIWFKYHPMKSEKMNRIMCVLSRYSFGAYLVHAMVIEQLYKQLGISTFSFNSAVTTFIVGIVVFGISFTISAIMNHIPIIKKYIV